MTSFQNTTFTSTMIKTLCTNPQSSLRGVEASSTALQSAAERSAGGEQCVLLRGALPLAEYWPHVEAILRLVAQD